MKRIFGPISFMLGSLCFADSAHPVLTVALDVRGSIAQLTLQEMQREIRKALFATGHVVQFQLRSEMKPDQAFEEIIVVQLKGRCEMDQTPVAFDERGPDTLAYTHSTDGEILPFTEVPCDRLRTSVRTAMWGDDFKRGDMLFGRAIGRVLSHEFFHILARTPGHGKKGIAKSSLSAAQLISEELRFSEEDADLVRVRSRLDSSATYPSQTDLP